MDELSQLQREIFDLTNILSLITKRAPDLEEQDNERSISELPRFRDGEIDLEMESEYVDEAEFDASVALENAEVDVIKRKALGRLAEVLARFKTGRGSQVPTMRNLDAKHVTSVTMVEDLRDNSVTFLCAKNEGLDTVDMDFLGKLEESLRNITENGKRPPLSRETGAEDGETEQVDQVFDILLDHLGPRVKYYSTILRDVIEEAARTSAAPKILTSRNVQEGLPQLTLRDWEDNNGLHFSFPLGGIGEEFISDRAADCLSDQGDETLVQEAYSEIQHLFGETAYEDQQIPLKNHLKKVYRIVRHPRQRPALKCLVRQAVHNNNQLFRKAWASLLFLTRIFYAAVTFVDLACRLRFTSLKFQQVSAAVAYKPKESDARPPTKVLASLGCSLTTRAWEDFFQTTVRVKEFIQMHHMKKTVHGEVQLILYVEDHLDARGKLPCKVFPYIGCSKKCCFFCELFREQQATFQARGTHQTLFPLWALPQIVSRQSFQVLRQFSKLLRGFLQSMLTMPCPPKGRDLLQQSSAAMSTAQVVQRVAPNYSTTPQTVRRMMFGFGGVSATEHQIEFLPLLHNPGYAMLLGGPERQEIGSVSIYEAEMTKINHERRTYMLEEIHEMPPTRYLDRQLCRHCDNLANYRCSACWTRYCSKACQKRNLASHVFTCRVSSRPNDVDFLRLVIQRVMREICSGDKERLHNAMLHLLADDHICGTFGFNNCENIYDIRNLVCLYNTILHRICPAVRALQEYVKTGNLGNFMERFCQLTRYIAQTTSEDECHCVTWFLKRWSSKSFLIPNRDKATYEIWVTAVVGAIESLDLTQEFENGFRPSGSQADVFNLYVAIQPTHSSLPDVYSSSWMKFGFCYCKSFSQRVELARKYLALAFSNATFDDIVSAYEASSLAELMRCHGIDISDLESQGIRLHMPPPCEYSVFRLMIGVEHALSGRFCSCFSVRESRQCHANFETHLDLESDTTFGFHLTNSWERWQLLNFYKYFFQLLGFDPACMAEAAEDSDLGSLENYLDTLVPDMRRKISNRYRSGVLFPRLKDRMGGQTPDGQTISHFHAPCVCKVHDVVGPPGICYLSLNRVLGTASVIT